MKEKCFLVTGASDGIGKATARMLLDEGAKVILVARREDRLKEIEAMYPEKAYAYPFDLGDLDHIEDIFKFCLERGIKLDGMLHAAGVSHNIPVKTVNVTDMMDTFGVNYFAAVQLGRFFSLKKYSNDGSSVVYMSSIAAEKCDKGMSQYAASKSAVNAFVKTMAKEVTRRKIRVNAVAPAAVDTVMTHEVFETVGDSAQEVMNDQPYGLIPVEQVVEQIMFLFSGKSSFVTGSVIQISAGMI